MPWQMTDTMPRRSYNNAVMAQTRDPNEDRYRDLRRPRKIRFYCNGDRYFKGKKLFITPHRYLTFQDLLNYLTGKLPSNTSLPYGVRQIYTPSGGRRVRDIEDLQDGASYVCAGFETFKQVKYGHEELKTWAIGKAPAKDHMNLFMNQGPLDSSPKIPYTHGAFHPSKLRQSYPPRRLPPSIGGPHGRPNYLVQSDNVPMKPKVITIIHNGKKTRNSVKILLNRRSVQSYDQLIHDIGESFGSKSKGNKIKKLYTIKGREVLSVSDFFRDEDIFIAVNHETISLSDVQEILNEVYSDNHYAQNVLRSWEKQEKKRQRKIKAITKYAQQTIDDEQKRDSGIGDSDESYKDGESDSPGHTQRISDSHLNRSHERKETQNEKERELKWKVEQHKEKAQQDERERARRKMQKKLQDERRRADEEKQKHAMHLGTKVDPFKKMDEARERERKDAERKRREEEKRKEEEKRQEELERQMKLEEEEQRRQEEIERRRREEIEKRQQKEAEKKEEELKARQAEEERRQVEEEKQKIEEEKKQAEMKEKQQQEEALRAQQEEIRHSRQSRLTSQPAESRAGNESVSPNRGKLTPQSEANRKSVSRNSVQSNQRSTSPQKGATSRQEVVKGRGKLENEVRSPPADNDKENNNLHDNENKKQGAITEQKSNLKRGKLGIQLDNAEPIFQKYDPGRTLGDGNFAIVKQCRSRQNSNEYAMKIIDKSKLKGKEHMVASEIEVMKLCNHQNIVKLYEEYETRDEIYLIMELVKGGDLFDAITQSVKFPEPEAARMTTDLTNALFYLHSRKVVHRDLKPENLMVCRNKDGSITLKLADFGLAMEVKEPIYTVCGTPTYVAPEILTEIGYGLEVDMWALGVITYILLCGFPPFRSPDRNQSELFDYIKSGEYEFLSPYWDGISFAAKDLIEHLLVVKKKNRYTAIDILTHPWIITVGGSLPRPENMDEWRKEKRVRLEREARNNLESFQRQKADNRNSRAY